MRIPPTIVFTKFEHLINDIISRIKEEEEENGEEISKPEKEARIIERSSQIITDYMKKILNNLPNAKFFIFNPKSWIYGYSF
jgi:sugar-specific transcriptional regulator TrmB